LFALDNTIVADVQPKIVDTFHEINKLPWISVSFTLGAATVNLLWYVDAIRSAKKGFEKLLKYSFLEMAGERFSRSLK
jgi:hypothetical protein